MSKSNIIATAVIIIILIAIIAFAGYQSFMQTPDTPNNATSTQDETNENKLVTAKHQYNASSSEHIVAGTLTLPTICHKLDTSVEINQKVTPVIATIMFDVTSTAESCAQAIGEARFKVNFEAPENTEIQAMLNGEPVELNLIPVAEGEDLSDFEIYIKG